jgi:hypothetical protein
MSVYSNLHTENYDLLSIHACYIILHLSRKYVVVTYTGGSTMVGSVKSEDEELL